tara:strand:- start:52 stop:450 length:399 start_codon:yes stop_codon:yes gene_type:complete
MKHFKHSYSELAKVGQRYYNDSGYCAVLATAVACDVSFGKALSFSRKAGRQHRKGSNLSAIHSMLALGGKKMTPIDNFGATLTTSERCAPKTGRYMFLVSGHVATMRDGVLEDWSQGGSKRKILVTYKIEDK